MADLVREWKRAVHDPEVKALRARIAELEAALRKINALIDSPARFNAEIRAVLDSVIDTSDVKFTA